MQGYVKMESIYRILKIVEGRDVRRLEFPDEWQPVIDECLDKAYIERNWRSDRLQLAAAGADFIALYEEMLQLMPVQLVMSY